MSNGHHKTAENFEKYKDSIQGLQVLGENLYEISSITRLKIISKTRLSVKHDIQSITMRDGTTYGIYQLAPPCAEHYVCDVHQIQMWSTCCLLFYCLLYKY